MVQEVVGAASVTSWRRYTAFGEVSAGTDAHEGRFFGYDAEEQSSVTGLVYLRFRHYDPEMGRFGVADTYLGDAFDPITLNRYLYCASDPVNHVDPTGHFRISMKWSYTPGVYGPTGAQTLFTPLKDPSHPNWYKPTGGTQIRGDSFANLPGQLTVWSGLISTRSSAATKRAQAQANTSMWLGQDAMRRGDLEAAKRYLGAAAHLIEEYQAIYCGAAQRLNEKVNSTARSFAEAFFWVPIAGTYADVLIYATEGNGPMFALTSTLFLSEALTLGGASVLKAGGKVALGAGMKTSSSTERVLSTSADMGGKITNVISKGDLKITFKHGDRHASEIGLDIDVIEEAIADDISERGVEAIRATNSKVHINIEGKDVEYGVHVLEYGTINVGTYHKPRG